MPAGLGRRYGDDVGAGELSLDTSRDGGRVVLAVAGELDAYTAPRLEEALRPILDEGGSTLAIDLLGVSFIDSTAVGVLIAAHRRATEQGGSVVLVVGPGQEQLRKVLEITRLHEVIPVVDSLDAPGT